MHYFITGATGFVGSNLAEACRQRGHQVSVLVRPGSDAAFLEQCGATVHRGDLTDADSVRRAVAGAQVVVHCAAKVGDWGPVESYRAVNVEGLRVLLEACRELKLERFIHLSTLGVYAARHHYGTDESEPPPRAHMDGYTQTKVEAEDLVLRYHREHQLPAVILRPGFVYGPRDRTVMPRLIDNLRKRRLRYLGSRKRALNTIYVGNLIDAICLAAERPKAVGQIYNLTDDEFVSKQRFIESIASGFDLPKPKPVTVPLWIARLIAWNMERQARKNGKAPKLTRAGIKFLGLNLDFSVAKAKSELGYQPRVGFDEGMKQTIAWYRQKG